MEEIWKEIKGFKDYFVSSFGRIRSEKGLKPIFISYNKNKQGYFRCSLSKDKKQFFFFVHRIVAENFIVNELNKKFVNHIDGNKLNNSIKNLEWCSQSENEKHAHKNGLKNHKGEKHPSNKLKEEDIIEIRRLFSLGITNRIISRKFKISESHCSNIIKNKKWTHINR